MPRIRDINGTTQRDRAYELLRRVVMLHEIAPGHRVREVEWAERLGVNRTAVREACGRLCAEGLVSDGLKGGYCATEMSPEELEEALEVRILVEARAVERICRLRLNRPRDLQLLRKACDELEWLLGNDYRVELAESDRRFHDALVTLAGNKRLTRVYRCIPTNGPMSADDQAQDWQLAAQAICKEHRAILAAIAKGSVVKAERLLRSHLAGKPGAMRAEGVGAA